MLFILYMNDLPHNTKTTLPYNIFADDTKVNSKVLSKEESASIQSD